MTDNDAPKPDQANTKAGKPDTGKTQQESPAADAENNLREPSENKDEPQVALEVMAALCREFGLDGFPGDASGNLFSPSPAKNTPQEPAETAFEIIQRFLFNGDVSAPANAPKNSIQSTTAAPSPNFNEVIPDPASVIAKAAGINFPSAPDQTEAPAMSNLNSETSGSSSESSAAQWGLTTIHSDGTTTNLNGPVIQDDMFRTAMPCLQGNASEDASTPDWAIKMVQGLPLSPGQTCAQTAIGAKLSAADLPGTLSKWRLKVGPSPDAQSELSVSLPTTTPSQLRALLFDTTAQNDSGQQMSEVPIYGGGEYALHLEQSIGSTSSEAAPNLALIRLIFADRAPIPAQLEYIGALPSPIIGGSIMVGPNYNIPFWVQITPPSEGEKGAGLVILVQYNQETSFNVTAQLLTESKTTTPTAILSCAAQSNNAACRAASMVSNSNGRLETNLTGLADIPDEADLPKYGFILPPPSTATEPGTDSGADTGTADAPAADETDNNKTASKQTSGQAKKNAPANTAADTNSDTSAKTANSSAKASSSSAGKASSSTTKSSSTGSAGKSGNDNASTKGDT